NPWKTSCRVNMPNGTILNLGIFPTLTDQNANKQRPQNTTKKPEHPQRSGFFAPFCPIGQYVLHRMLTLNKAFPLYKDSFNSFCLVSDNDLQ
ncbi:MAG: hypothetical protein K2M31_07285, partial [Muribaculaceae bacterium]|nr:hypothetical protein [Muribaculaceae bacterium]